MIEWKDNNPVVTKPRWISADRKWEKTIDDGYVCISGPMCITDSNFSSVPVGYGKDEYQAWVNLLKAYDATIHNYTVLRAEVADIIKAQKKNGK